jgi:predicted nuclease of predicted toxin-antitoxin system
MKYADRITFNPKHEDFAIRAQPMDANASPVIVWMRIGNTSNHVLRLWLMPQLPQVIAWIEAFGESVKPRSLSFFR